MPITDQPDNIAAPNHSNSLNIIYITRAYGEHGGGMERLSFELARELNKLPFTRVSVIAHRSSRVTSPLHNLRSLPRVLQFLWFFQGKWKSSSANSPYLTGIRRQSTVILLGDPMLAFAGSILRLITRRPVAVIVHGLDITYSNVLYQLYLRIFARHFQRYLPISNYTNTLLGHLKPKGKRYVFTPGVTDNMYQQNVPRSQLSELLGISAEHICTLATVGRLVNRKGHAWFIRCILPILSNKVHYIIAGSGPAEHQIRQAINDTGTGARVHLLGRVTSDQLAVIYNTVDAFIQPNINSKHDIEGFGLVLLEAALCNRAVLAADIDGIPDAIRHAKNGLLLPAENETAWIEAINKLTAGILSLPPDPRGYTLKTFNWHQQAVRFRSVLQELNSQQHDVGRNHN